ncbi:hypothetical protein FD30_GL001088 [Levilactobacillus namurensis DSM 19117]|uniref:EfeO-type cupredoxin-like domain-containing protein n=2 Tax=Levilactobacillus namurensis TaxID=380393 RepID=A0A0R1K094_9LACO|nr:cupredoxin domain-containing protein [Levilactobacillus namurensis]KRK72759.1 hypothetical protein FD30_GL001088 [Levilactobacillus namurensis DSM 19117]MDT7014386.1 cupredoxin domain-containing protein [Levilactobacillus namurensis]GEO74388.1 copper-binding protein [Levilactobacillus namurensis]HJE44857.1 cupredoxin domain-containing protein [Levilactobacillus namurensis]
MTNTVQNKAVTVAGGYQPQTVHFQQGVPATLSFTRTSAQGCLDVVHSAELGFETDLPLDTVKTVKIPTDQAGTFTFSCGMDMFSGNVVIDQ